MISARVSFPQKSFENQDNEASSVFEESDEKFSTKTVLLIFFFTFNSDAFCTKKFDFNVHVSLSTLGYELPITEDIQMSTGQKQHCPDKKLFTGSKRTTIF